MRKEGTNVREGVRMERRREKEFREGYKGRKRVGGKVRHERKGKHN